MSISNVTQSSLPALPNSEKKEEEVQNQVKRSTVYHFFVTSKKPDFSRKEYGIGFMYGVHEKSNKSLRWGEIIRWRRENGFEEISKRLAMTQEELDRLPDSSGSPNPPKEEEKKSE